MQIFSVLFRDYTTIPAAWDEYRREQFRNEQAQVRMEQILRHWPWDTRDTQPPAISSAPVTKDELLESLHADFDRRYLSK